MSVFRLATLPRLILPSAPTLRRTVHHSLPLPPLPPVSTAVPNSATFLKLIGRGASAHAAKLESWESLFKSTSAQLKEAGVEPARLRRYIISQRERYRVAGGRVEVREVKRGVKKDGGERRRKMIRAVRGTEEFREKRRQEEKDGVELGDVGPVW